MGTFDFKFSVSACASELVPSWIHRHVPIAFASTGVDVYACEYAWCPLSLSLSLSLSVCGVGVLISGRSPSLKVRTSLEILC